MRLLRSIGEDEMIAVFLRGELAGRYRKVLQQLLAAAGHDERLLRSPNLDSAAQNRARRALLEEHRAYERREGLFFGFPAKVAWHRAVLSREEVLEIRYINWDWWLRISGGTRRPLDAARRIRAGQVPGVTAEEDEPLVATWPQPELIAVTTEKRSPLVLLEGHVRLTAYALFPDRMPDELEVLLGISDEMRGWSEF